MRRSSSLVLVLVLLGLLLPQSSVLAYQPFRIQCRGQTATAGHRQRLFKTHATSKKKSNTNRAGIGFGAAPEPATTTTTTTTTKPPKTIRGKDGTKDSSDDYAVFPALEEKVLSTLIPAASIPSIEDTAILGGINDEVYDRLDQIYGLPNFNHPESADITGVSFGDLLSTAADDVTSDDRDSEITLKRSVSYLPSFESIRVLHMDPLVLAVDRFFSDDECDRYISMSLRETTVQTRSPTVGKDATAKAQRTSTTFYHTYESVPEFLGKTARLLGMEDLDRLEEVQTVRYRRDQRFTWHLDALGPGDLALSGQRVATLLVYLTDMAESDGGATLFRDLDLAVRPRKGTALLFFPAAGGIPGAPVDIRTLHCGEAVGGDSTTDKWIAQVWVREKPYRPTVPPGNVHSRALRAVEEYCRKDSIRV